MEALTDILVLPFFGQGHLFPCVELCKNLSLHNIRSILIIPSHLSSSIPSNLHQHPLIEVLQVPASNSPPPPKREFFGSGSDPKPVHHHQELGLGIESFLSERYNNIPGRRCVVMDVMMSWSKDIFRRANIPIVSFFTSGACGTAMEYAAWKARVDELGPNETRMLPGLPESMALSYSDLKRRDHRHGGGGGPGRGGGRPGGMNFGPVSGGGPGRGGGRPGGMNFGPPRPGQQPRWIDEAEGSISLLLNTCDDLEAPFLNYLKDQIGIPVFGVGPLLPEKYWKSIDSVIRDRDSRPNRESNYTEEEVIEWLDSKPARSVIYVSFGSEVGPSLEEYDQLADALTESEKSFIWVIQPGSGIPGPPANFFGASKPKEGGYYPHGMEEKVGKRGLIIKGWAPQLSILSHPSTGGFLSHCGWNSTLEAIGCGVPILAWPIRGDQFYDANLVVKYLKVGYMVASGDVMAEMVKKTDIMQGIQKVMDDVEVHDRAGDLKEVFKGGYPSSSESSLKALIELISK